ncbi:zinc-binding alcohol dehydrogenase [Sediminicoccus sp. KRV36]|uniref:zinc-dependent alcohol dehydrogenase n=1 Tax=Sediminicoccus sp. KRV36 TaxID=3133721 RepID=UPI00200C066B|nr:zinc-binding alcohol dehydrogenase [Sediminicoccus rosea]UPY35361.1 zinc-binding alcohol dehydrogenase [Sediminicoccus rosea]
MSDRRETMAQALWHVAPGKAELRAARLALPAEGELLVQALTSGLSRGTERLVHHGRVPASQHAAMRCPMQEGDFGFPVKYGYAAVGRVEQGAPEFLGRRVFALHPHQSRFVIPAHFCALIPDGVSDDRACLGANMETALNVMWDAAPRLGERALIIGAGVVGLLCAFLLARMPGVAVTVVDRDPAKAALARGFGADFALPDAAPRDQELIIHASASAAGLRLALACAAFEGRILEASWFGDAEPALPLGAEFHQKRLQLISTQVGSVSPAMRGRRSHGQRMALALSLLEDARLDALLGPVVAFEDLPASLPALLDPPPGAPQPLCPVIRYA